MTTAEMGDTNEAIEALETPAATEETPAVDAPPADETPEARADREAKARSAERVTRAVESERKSAALREEKRAKQARERVASERMQLQREREAREKEQREYQEAIKKGGPAALKARLGMDYKDLTKTWIDESSPEGQERARIAQLLEENNRRVAELTQREQQRQVEANFVAIEGALESRAEEFPHAYAMSSKMFRGAVPAVAQMLINQGRQPTQSLVLKTLDELEKAEHTERETRRTALQKRSKTGPSNGASSLPGSSNASRAVRTLTTQDGTERSRERSQKTEAEKDEEILANLREMFRGS